jgi:hypothetical protein
MSAVIVEAAGLGVSCSEAAVGKVRSGGRQLQMYRHGDVSDACWLQSAVAIGRCAVRLGLNCTPGLPRETPLPCLLREDLQSRLFRH